ncbi:MAG: hypothetical protein HY791_38710 [Deltaproteobacteria bacterium]|nr:hypothetical protein [Deltaproteobacteria bacterium]
MSAGLIAVARWVHFVGFAVAFGASVAALFAHRSARKEAAPDKSGLEVAAASAITSVELPGLFLALFAGIALIAAFPAALDPKSSGAGPWLHIKLAFVLALLGASHVRMFRARRLTRERKAGASEAECEQLASAARTLGAVDVCLFVVIIALATMRFVLFGGAA